jgi:NAD(P)-dependent dehydrogenase (short-subunit alcohol dehydrogenase family)
MDTNQNRDKTVVITGTSRGIGNHLARRFLKEGFKVVGISRSETDINDDRFQHIKADMGNLDDIPNIVDKIDANSVCGIINNAGVHGPLGPFERNTMKEWVEAFNVNLFGGASLTQSLIPALKKNKGFVIFLSGGGSGFAKPNFSAYSVSKTAVVRLAENLAKELYPDVYVYCVAPGPNRTDMLNAAVHAGDNIREEDIVNFDEPEKLCMFLANNRDPRYSGKFIHVVDKYDKWGEEELSEDMYKLRRTKVMK